MSIANIGSGEVITVARLPISAFTRIRTLAETAFNDVLDTTINDGSYRNARAAIVGREVAEKNISVRMQEIRNKFHLDDRLLQPAEQAAQAPPQFVDLTRPGSEVVVDVRGQPVFNPEQGTAAELHSVHASV